ncbi:MAG: HAMP domain-containing histidine kinase [Comamonadaceae bacterium]|nr:MAG: HAMP domain-containing histidine kinase [Comamonadaceae bacterium]
MRLQELLTMGGRIFHQTHFNPLLQLQGSVSEVKFEVRHRDGRTMPMVINAIRSKVDGEVHHDIAVFMAHDRHKYELELLASRKRSEALGAEAHRLRELADTRAAVSEQMMGIVSHDLRNPLTLILMSTEMLRKGNPSATQLKIADRVARAVAHSNRLISDLLDFTAAQMGSGLVVKAQACDINAAMAQCVDDLAQAFPDNQVRHIAVGQGTRLADAGRLNQLVGNLVANAVAYGSDVAPITVTSTVDAGGFSIAVSNAGEPIPESVRGSLFKPMSRGTTDGAASSIGLGLFIVKEIAKAHGGTVDVESDATGTTFTALFPGSATGR